MLFVISIIFGILFSIVLFNFSCLNDSYAFLLISSNIKFCFDESSGGGEDLGRGGGVFMLLIAIFVRTGFLSFFGVILSCKKKLFNY